MATPKGVRALILGTSNKVNQWMTTSRRVFSEWLEKNISNASNEIIGLTINTDFLKLVKINSDQEQPEVVYYAVKPLPAGLVSKNTLVDIPAIAAILNEALNEAKLPTRNVAIALSRSSVIIKNINLDHRLTPDEVEERIWIEANRLFPDLITDIYLDFVVTGPSAQEPDMNEVVIIACRKNQLHPYIELAEQSNLQLRIVDINHYALERSISLITPQIQDVKAAGILSINYNSIHLTVFEGSKLVYSHELNYDGSSLRKKIDLDESKQMDLIHAHLGANLQYIMQFFYTSRPNIWVDKLIVADDCAAHIPMIVDYIKRETNKHAVLADPFTQMKIAPHLDKQILEKVAPSLLLCCGVAMSRVVR